MRDTKRRVAVLIPCYNEAATIARVVGDFKNAPGGAEIYVYDNNSTDDTARVAEAAGAIVRREPRQGKGNVVRAMFRSIDADCYILVDGDDTYDAADSVEMSRLVLDENADMVIGDRLSSTYFTENKRAFHNFGNRLVRKCVNVFFNGNISDVMTGYRALSRNFVKTFPVLSEGFEIETEMTIHALDKNFLIRALPVKYRDRPEGSVSKLDTFSDGGRVLFMIFNLYRFYKPLRFFGTLAFAFFAAGLIMFIPVFVEYMRIGLVPRFPTLIASGVSCMLSLQLAVCGLILDTITKIDRRNFELQRTIVLLNSETRDER